MMGIQFEDFWEMYNYKIAKKAARKAWSKLSEADKRDVMDCLPERLLTDKQWLNGYKMHPATFLNGERWEDEYEKSGRSNSESIIERLQRVAASNTDIGIQRDNKVVRFVRN